MDFETARTKMVDNQIRTTDVTDWRILRAFSMVPREIFVPQARKTLSYIDGDMPLGGGRFLMEASPFAKIVQLAGIREGDAVLVVGCASGYSAAILSHLAARIVALECDEALAAQARDNLGVPGPAALGSGATSVVVGQLEAGHAASGPYDVILFDGAVETVPAAIFTQLADGGRLVAVEGIGNAAAARLYIKEHGAVSSRFGFNCSVRPLPGFAKTVEFVF